MTDETNNTEKAQVKLTEPKDSEFVPKEASNLAKTQKEPMTLNRIRTKDDFFEYLLLNKAELEQTLMWTLIRTQKPANNIYLFPPAMDVKLSLAQAVLSAIQKVTLTDDLSEMDSLNFNFNDRDYVLAHSASKRRDEIERIQEKTGGLQSDTVEDVATMRFIFFPKGRKKPKAADYPLYKILRKL